MNVDNNDVFSKIKDNNMKNKVEEQNKEDTLNESSNSYKQKELEENNIKIINEFEDYLNIQGYSQKTIDVYKLMFLF